jgi:hypothetical protein
MSTPLAHQVSNFVKACEALHSGLIEGHVLTIEDRDMIQQTAAQLLIRAEASTGAPSRALRPSSHGVWKRWDQPLNQESHREPGNI